MAQDPNPAIELLVSQIEELERKANAYRASVNVLCAQDGRPPLYPDGGGNGSGARTPSAQGASPINTQITNDRFYGKPQQTAVRELLQIRKASGLSAAKPAEILEGLKAGGYVVEAKSDDIALVGLRAMLRKRSNIFHKLPNGAWGLKEWYPNAKTATKPAGPDVAQNPGQSENADLDSDVTEPQAETETAETDEATAAA
jgi:hypothetical protein